MCCVLQFLFLFSFFISSFFICILLDDSGFKASNKMRNINGYMYGNLPGLRMCKGDNVSWHLMGGPAEQMHTASFYGNTFIRHGNNYDTVGLMEG